MENQENQTVLVTGGAGFIGSHVIEELLHAKRNVVCIDSCNDFYNPQQKEKNIALFSSNPLFSYYQVDITKKEDLKKVFDKHNITKIVHLAARAGVRQSIKNPTEYVETNIVGTINLLELAKDNQCQKFVFASSSSVYGDSTIFPQQEDNIEMQCSPYAISKKCAEDFVQFYAKHFNLSIAILRFFTVFGPRGRPDMATYKFISAIAQNQELTIFGDGTTQRDFTYVKDTVQGICKALETKNKSVICNIGSVRPVSLNEYVQVIAKILEKTPQIVHKERNALDVKKTHADITRAKELLNYAPQWSIEDGLRKTVDWFLSEQHK